MPRTTHVLAAVLVAGSAVIASMSSGGGAASGPDTRDPASADAGIPDAASADPIQDAPPSAWAGTLRMDPHERHGTASDGDLWPSCWSDDGSLYAAWGDGKGFDLDGEFSDIGVARIEGEPGNLRGVNLAQGDEVGPIWAESGYNRKPTGMVCVGDTIHLAVQDLALDFNDVPNATIVTSTDGGRTWTWDESGPMFDDHTFTTMWFADFGQGGEWSEDGYVYVYGLDNNWRDSFNDRVQDPTNVYLARVPEDRVADRRAWQFYAGSKGADAKPRWSKKIDDRRPVLHDSRRVYQQMLNPDIVHDMTVLSQGHVLYNKPLDRYLYTSWTEYTLEMYESPTPWGPWSRMESHDFGGYPWGPEQHAGYGATIPSKFLSDDGRTMMLQSNVCPCAPSGTPVYRYSLRQVELVPGRDVEPSNPLDGGNLATDPGTVAVSKSVRQGDLGALNDGATDVSLDDSDEELKRDSWWGYTWPEPKRMNRVVYTTGEIQDGGGWFLGRPRVQVRQDGHWVDVAGQVTDPVYPGRESVGSTKRFTVTFPETVGDGVRVIGVPGGDLAYSSMSEVEVYDDLALIDGGFEGQTGGVGGAWTFVGGAAHGIDGNGNHSHSGAKNAWVRTSEPLGPQLLTQTLRVEPGETLDLSAWVRTSDVVETVRLGVRYDGGEQIETFAGVPEWTYTRRATSVTVPDDVTEVTVVVGYDADGGDAILQVDDVALTR
ncbi:uncharacterized protein DUF4185 [Haloactinopolyspora alba]|uniref:Uncharacterized protein DUF4185 n=1 Tax=Haloactinopolyspora alba TaxID=648780 RepID=A0A2P8DRF6_9ACTN|nr:DUF4185 domain-containing protein [Haloactinopolyspora alba]PSK99795.1 uncharacterized protein DUF4185 [Haloactinopolyspora alba]